MKDDGFIDLTGEDRLWRLHRVSAVILLALVIVHLWLRLPWRTGDAAAWQPRRDLAEDALLACLAIVAIFHVLIGIRHLRRLCPMLWPRPGQRHFMSWCIAAERYSGLTLAGFLGIHLCLLLIATTAVPDLDTLSLQIGGRLVMLAEGGVLMLLDMHDNGGIRVLIQESFSTHRLDRPLAFLAVACAILTPFAWWLARSG